MEWSKGVIFLIATFWPEGLCRAELPSKLSLAVRTYYETTQKLTSEDNDLPDNTICTFANDILNVILLRDIERDLS
jgi:hypothetical protein